MESANASSWKMLCAHQKWAMVSSQAAMDNIDHNPISGTAKDSFHGVGISLIRHPTHECADSDRGMLVMNRCSSQVKPVGALSCMIG